MRYLFSPQGLIALERLKLDPKPLLVFDFDGTIAPFAGKAWKTFTPKANAELLRRLSRRTTTAVISGRGVNDLKLRIGFKPRYIAGNHGMEGAHLSAAMKAESRRATRSVTAWYGELTETRRQHWVELAEYPGVFLEDKGYSLSFIYKLAKNPQQTKRDLLKIINTLKPRPRVIGGFYTLNLLPTAKLSKGTAMVRLLAITKSKTALYVGDDPSDEDVFKLKRRGLLSIRVGRKASSAADFYVRDQKEVHRLLVALERN